MKTFRALWKILLVIAVVAFLAGLLPYFWLLISTATANIPFAHYVGSLLTTLWNTVVAYLPLIMTIYVISVALLIFFEGQNPDRTILWLFTLIFIPVIGIIAYAILGPDLKRMKTRKLFRPAKTYPPIHNPDWQHAPVRIKKAATLAFRNSNAEVYERGAVEILIDGRETFPRLAEALRGAKRYINIEYFIFRDDRLGHEIADILCDRARSGVTVRMMVDGVGSWKLGHKMIRTLKDAGVQFRTFMPVSYPFFHSSVNFRNHRKIVVVDGDVALTGGLNVGVEYLGEGALGNWRDTHAYFHGGTVYALNTVFLEDWAISSGEKLSPADAQFVPTDPTATDRLPPCPMQIVSSGSSSAWHAIQQMYLLMITEAQRRIWITSPYLVPDASILSALHAAALAGIDVRILIPAKADHFLSYWAGRSNIENLLRAGVRVLHYTNGFIHAKTLVMDDAICSVGTTNLDNRSLEINFEVQAFIYDEAMCEEFARQFLLDCGDAEECILSVWEKRSVGSRVLESLGRLWSSQI